MTRRKRRFWRLPLRVTVMLLGGGLGGVIALAGRNVIPDKYYRDDTTLRQFMQSTPLGFGDSSYGRTAHFYDLLGLSSLDFLRGCLAAVMVAVVILRCRPKGRDPWPMVTIFAAEVLAGVYLLPMYSKEFFVLPLIVLFVVVGPSLMSEAVWLAAVLIYGNEMRANWIAVAVLYIALRVTLHRVRDGRKLVGIVVAAVLVLAVYFQAHQGVPLHFYRYDVVDALSADINTRITDPLAGSGLLSSWLNGLYSGVAFCFPFPLIALLNPVYLLAGAFIAVTWAKTWRKVWRMIPKPRRREDVRLWRAFALLFAYTFAQSLYAPDWGAYFRHISPLVPLFALFLDRPAVGLGIRRRRLTRRTPVVPARAQLSAIQ